LIDEDSINAQVYYGKITDKGVVDDIQITDMTFIGKDERGVNKYSAKIELKNGGDYGYTFRVIPKNKMLLNPMNLNLIKWITE
jgi:starch phosphorylase